VFEDRVLRKISWSKRDEVTGSGENCISMSLIMSIPNQILLGFYQMKKNEMGVSYSIYAGEER
jgi:hypothetical protein